MPPQRRDGCDAAPPNPNPTPRRRPSRAGHPRTLRRSEARSPARAEAPAAAPAPPTKTHAEMATKLAAAQAAAVERLTARLQTVEGQLAAPKNDARATVRRGCGRGRGRRIGGEARRRASLLSALRQGDDYSAQLAALQNFGVDPARLAALRAGLSAPAVHQLAASFAALAPELAAAAAPSNPAEAAKPVQDARGSILGFLSMEAHKPRADPSAGGARQSDAAAPRSTGSRRICAPAISPARFPRASSCPRRARAFGRLGDGRPDASRRGSGRQGRTRAGLAGLAKTKS